jgi:hypothetical protein
MNTTQGLELLRHLTLLGTGKDIRHKPDGFGPINHLLEVLVSSDYISLCFCID